MTRGGGEAVQQTLLLGQRRSRQLAVQGAFNECPKGNMRSHPKSQVSCDVACPLEKHNWLA